MLNESYFQNIGAHKGFETFGFQAQFPPWGGQEGFLRHAFSPGTTDSRDTKVQETPSSSFPREGIAQASAFSGLEHLRFKPGFSKS
jgi:hypothetical protein